MAETRWIATQDGQYINLAHVGRLFVKNWDTFGPNVRAEYAYPANEFDNGERIVGSYDTEADAKLALARLMGLITDHQNIQCAHVLPRDFRIRDYEE